MPPPVVQVRVSTSVAGSCTGWLILAVFFTPAGSLLLGTGRGQLMRWPLAVLLQAMPWLVPAWLPLRAALGLGLGAGLALGADWGLALAAAAGTAAAVPSPSTAAAAKASATGQRAAPDGCILFIETSSAGAGTSAIEPRIVRSGIARLWYDVLFRLMTTISSHFIPIFYAIMAAVNTQADKKCHNFTLPAVTSRRRLGPRDRGPGVQVQVTRGLDA